MQLGFPLMLPTLQSKLSLLLQEMVNMLTDCFQEVLLTLLSDWEWRTKSEHDLSCLRQNFVPFMAQNAPLAIHALHDELWAPGGEEV